MKHDIIITGASRGIGKNLYEYYQSDINNEYNIIGIYLFTKPEHIGNFEKVDIGNRHEVHSFFDKYELKNPILINCAAINYNAMLHKSNFTDWWNVIDINVVGTYNMIKHILKDMRKQEYGRIINFSSVVGQRPKAGTSAYATSKSALSGLTKAVAIENAEYNITCNNIILGYSELGMIKQIPEPILKEIIDSIPCKHLCPFADIAKTVDYLIDTPYVNGAEINLTGGLL